MRGARGPRLPKLNVSQGQPPSPQPPRPDMDSRATLTIGDQTFVCEANDLVKIRLLGRGAYGIVEEMRHTISGIVIAVKRIQATVNNQEQKRLLMDLDVNMRSGSCPYTVHFYGALFREGDVWICMEVMETSLDKLYKAIISDGNKIPEAVLKNIALSVVKALHYLHSELQVIHRDVKPSNILINRKGEVKICDFGISGYLVDSIARTKDAGCRPYMGPERINPENVSGGYDIRSDVWSLGITMIELATGVFPYSTWSTPFEQIRQVVMDAPPKLPANEFSPDFEDFITQCLQKDYKMRPNYTQLMEHPFFVMNVDAPEVDMAEFVNDVLTRHADLNNVT
ncbi:dual specificity mitogen-activated protein kinase kinase 6 [Patella vulgata]|uniref:dual specificity mitogen-activated protein kinase kinase 6 n=1 Tax=Patella vulgata TaxID=6465 RepID=UPI0024A88C43|nr:dual specificity mitogen-activated protein kinase kinase 6 [Patella vulgata]